MSGETIDSKIINGFLILRCRKKYEKTSVLVIRGIMCVKVMNGQIQKRPS